MYRSKRETYSSIRKEGFIYNGEVEINVHNIILDYDILASYRSTGSRPRSRFQGIRITLLPSPEG